jgi:hypothetical protein
LRLHDKYDTTGTLSRTLSMTTGVALSSGAKLKMNVNGAVFLHGYYTSDAP